MLEQEIHEITQILIKTLKKYNLQEFSINKQIN
jgi:hypothetical protein